MHRTNVPLLLAFIGVHAIGGCGGVAAGSEEDGDLDSTQEELARNLLSTAEERNALRIIDRMCGDTWCSGDYNYLFRRLNCSERASACTLLFMVIPREGVPSQKRFYWRSCKTNGFTSYQDVIGTTSSGYEYLQDDYYDALTQCIDRVEVGLRESTRKP